MSERELEALGTKRKALPSLPRQAAQVLQDFGAGPILLSWPLSIIFDVDSKSSAMCPFGECLPSERFCLRFHGVFVNSLQHRNRN